MAKQIVDAAAQARAVMEDIRRGVFSPVYLLMGDEPYYPDLVCQAIIDNALTEDERDFNQTVYYGLDTDAGTVASEARSYPMMAERRLVVLKEAQNMKSLEELSVYCEEPMDSTVLVILMHGASADKRKSLYKNVKKVGTVLESPAIRDYEIERWIVSYFRGRGLDIAPDAAALFGEYAGTDLGRIAVETDKLLKSLPEGTVSVSASDIEKNVGVSRQFSIFELTRELSSRNKAKALRIAANIGSAPKFAMPMAVSALYNHFYRILKYQALLMRNPRPSGEEKAAVLGVSPYFFKEYDMAVRQYPLRKCMWVMSLLEEYDYKGKGGDAGEAKPEELLLELVSKILN
ncbi:MAG: DNA polymerase III subunit delta [Bacteroidales bacterium]|nr:DNA polymerase III subunit delta [Bacteroidales bacterium]